MRQLLVSRPLREVAYSLGAVATALSYQGFSTYIIFFYVDVMKLALAPAAVGMLLYAMWNAVNDPLVGMISDTTKTRMGRRIPYIAFGAVPFGIVYFLLWAPPVGSGNMLLLFLYFLFVICAFDGLYSIVVLNWASLYPEMFKSLEDRSRVNALRQFFGVIGLIIGIALPPLIYSRFGWRAMGAVFGLIITLAYLISLFGAREKDKASRIAPLSFTQAVRATLSNRPFLAFVTSNLFVQYSFVMVLAVLPFFAKYALLAGPEETTRILLFAFLFEVPMLFVWAGAACRLGAKTVYMAAILCFALSLLSFFFVRDLLWTAAAAALLGASLGGVIVLSDVLIADIIDFDESRTGLRREGAYFGVNAFVTRFAIALEAASLGLVFHLTGYDPSRVLQPQQFILGLRLLISAFASIGMLLAFALMFFYPLSGKPASRQAPPIKTA